MKFLSDYFFSKQDRVAGYVTKLLILGLDLSFALIAFFTALLITGNFDLTRLGILFLGWAPLLVVLLRGTAFILFKTYLIIIRYVGEKDYKNVFYAVTASSLAFGLSLEAFPKLLPPDETLAIVLVDFGVLLLLAGGFRIVLRLFFDQLRLQGRSHLNTVIFGAGELGAILARVLRHNVTHNYRTVAFFDDNHHIHRKILNGIPVYDPRKNFGKVIRKHDIKVAIIGINNIDDDRRIEFINQCLAHQVKVLKVPPAELWIEDRLKLSGQLQDIRFEDLLNRPPIQLDKEAINHTVRDRVVLVTGCAGSIGSEIVRQLLRFEPRMIIGFDQAETPLAEISLELQREIERGVFRPIIGDVRDYPKLQRLFEEYRPEYVFHAAAYKHVPIMERFPEEAIGVNVQGTRHVANLAAEHGVRKFVMISTDKVVNPSNVMGASKRIAEIYVQALNDAPGNKTQFITTRFGNVLGSNGSVIPIFKRQIEARKPVTVTHPNVTRFFMTIPEACQLVLEAGAMGNGGEIFVFDMGEPVRILDLAKKMIQMAGLAPGKDVKIKFTGLRPGEKLTEELLDKQEDILPTHHPKIRKASVRMYPYKKIQMRVDTLIDKINGDHSSLDLVRHMKEIVPEFASQNSDFEILDSLKKPKGLLASNGRK